MRFILELTSTLGASTDLLDEELRRILVNASYHLLQFDVPKKADVNFVGKYRPSQYGFHTDEYWLKSNLRVEQFKEEYGEEENKK